MAKRKSFNPFYVLLVIVGIAFVVSACAFGVMAYRGVSLGRSGEPLAAGGLMAFMDQHGMILLGAQVLLLGLFTVGAIGTDEFWQRRARGVADIEPRKAEFDTGQSHVKETSETER